MRRILIFSLALFACKQPNSSTKLSKTELDTIVDRMNDKVSYELYVQPTLDPLRNYLVNLEDTVKKLNYNRLTFYWLIQKAQLLMMENKSDSVKLIINHIKGLTNKENIRRGDLLNFYIIYNSFLKDQGELDSALRVANEAYFLAREIDTPRLTQTSLDLASIYQLLDDLPNLQKYSFEAWKHSKAEPELKNFVGRIIAYYYDRTGKIDSAIYFFENSRKDSFLVNKPEDLADNFENTAVFLNKKGNLKEGLQLQLEAKAIYDSLGMKSPENYLNLGETYGRLKQYNKALTYTDTARWLAEERNDYNLIRIAWKNKAEQYAKIPDYKNAMAALDSAYSRYTIEIDSSLREQARELEMKYAVRDKDNQIQTLALTNEANLKVRKQQRITIITIIIASLFLAVIGMLLWRRRQTQMLLRETNLRQQLLRTQMEPHFLFNALGILQNMIRMQITDKAINYLNKLSRLIQYNFENASENLVLLKDEVDALDGYLNLQVIYKPELFDYQLDVYQDFEEDVIYIPPMLLQPFLENAIYHGFSNIDYKGNLKVSIEKNGYTLHCTIDDNGKGFQSSEEDIRPHSTAINQERLSILARQMERPAKLNIIKKSMTNEGNGIRVEIDIPFRINKSELRWKSKIKDPLAS